MKKFLLLLAAGASFAGATCANAATFVGLRTIGSATANLSITTDDTLGALSSANILDWTITLDDGLSMATLTHGNSTLNSAGGGLGFVTTATELLFDFGGSNTGFAFLLNGNNAYCLVTTVGCGGVSSVERILLDGTFYTQPGQGREVIATLSTGTGAVPEPAAWALMLVGFAGVGATMRARKTRAAISCA